jgi:hypothetical protein
MRLAPERGRGGKEVAHSQKKGYNPAYKALDFLHVVCPMFVKRVEVHDEGSKQKEPHANLPQVGDDYERGQ